MKKHENWKNKLIVSTLVISMFTSTTVYAASDTTTFDTDDYTYTPPAVTDITQFSDYTVDLGGGIIKGHWAEKNDDIQRTLAHRGISGLPDGEGGYKFEPNRSITTAELLSIILSASNNSPTTGTWPTNVTTKAAELGIIPNSMVTEGNTPITREKMAMVLVNAATNIRDEDTASITFDPTRIADLNEADAQYRSYIQTAYGMGLLAGTGTGYAPKSNTTRAETCAIINRLFGYTPRVDNKLPEEKPQQPTGLSPLPDGSNVGASGIIYPKEGDVINGVVVTRDPETGVLGFGNGQKGGIYLGITYPTNGASIQVGSMADPDGYDNANGIYEKKGDYIFWSKEWAIIQGNGMEKVETTSNPTAGMVADIHGNLMEGDFHDPEAFFVYNGSYWQWCGDTKN